MAAADYGNLLSLEADAAEQHIFYVIDILIVSAGNARYNLIAATGDDDAIWVERTDAGNSRMSV